ncbi:MBOAT family protein [soil metagenome]
MTNLAFVSLSLFFFFGLVRNSKNSSLSQAAVVAVGSGIYVAQFSASDFVYLFLLTQASFGLFRFLSARPRRTSDQWVWLAAVATLILQLTYFKAMGPSRAHLPVGLAYLTLQLLGIFIWSYFHPDQSRISWIQFNFSSLFFPTIVAGPIVRTEKIAMQLDRLPPIDIERIKSAFLLVCLGLFKKTVADQLALYTSSTQVALHPVGLNAALLTVAFYSQCYADFSGYSDIARGLGRAYGIEIPLNFNLPFYAANISEHWKRWHISLYEWFRNFVFTWFFASHFSAVKRRLPFVSMRVYLGLSILFTCLLIGAWHGIEQRFFIWALLNGVFIIFHQAFFSRFSASGRAFHVASIVFTFSITCFLNLLFFDAPVSEISRILRSALNPGEYILSTAREHGLHLYAATLIALSIFGLHSLDRRLIQADYRVRSRAKFLGLTLFTLVYCFAAGAIHQAFLYGQF